MGIIHFCVPAWFSDPQPVKEAIAINGAHSSEENGEASKLMKSATEEEQVNCDVIFLF
jgi:hypothetical protein